MGGAGVVAFLIRVGMTTKLKEDILGELSCEAMWVELRGPQKKVLDMLVFIGKGTECKG